MGRSLKMTEAKALIDLAVSAKLKGDPNYRWDFFKAENDALIAEQLIALRERRGLTQTQAAEKSSTHQPAVSRMEKSDYENRTLNAIQRLADAYDARVRVVIEAFEDVLNEYEENCASASVPEQTSMNY
jgi:predicted XRE-type DNA-binding protein